MKIEDSALWDTFCRKEEADETKRDQHNCFEYEFSSRKNVREPVVSQYLVDNGATFSYPDDKEFAMCLTHDVDEIYPPFVQRGANAAYLGMRGHIGSAFKWMFKNWEREENPLWNFDQVMDLEEKYGACSSFYFLATDRDIQRFRYNIVDLNNALHNIAQRGGEVGLHGGYYAYNDFDAIINEKERIEKVLSKSVVGYRNHYLRFSYPQTFELLENAGFLYDTTLGYNYVIGYRAGMCHPFHPYNPKTNEFMKITEIPMAVMDYPLLRTAKNPQEAWESVKQMIDTASKLHGAICLNFHTNNFNCPFRENMSNIYSKILEYGQKKGAWMTSGEELIKKTEIIPIEI